MEEIVSWTKKVDEKLKEVLARAKVIWGRDFPMPRVTYNVRGGKGGVAYWHKNLIDLNYAMMNREGQAFIDVVVPHELIHILTHYLFGAVSAHGSEWKTVMRRLGQKAERTHSFSTEGLKRARNVEKVEYKCSCQTHKLSLTLHNRIKAGGQYTCKKCRGLITRDNPQPISMGSMRIY